MKYSDDLLGSESQSPVLGQWIREINKRDQPISINKTMGAWKNKTAQSENGPK